MSHTNTTQELRSQPMPPPSSASQTMSSSSSSRRSFTFKRLAPVSPTEDNRTKLKIVPEKKDEHLEKLAQKNMLLLVVNL